MQILKNSNKGGGGGGGAKFLFHCIFLPKFQNLSLWVFKIPQTSKCDSCKRKIVSSLM